MHIHKIFIFNKTEKCHMFQGYNNWVPGMYGYSWDMMVHEWDIIFILIKVHDNVNNKVRYLDPDAWVQGYRWVNHGDMAIQYTQCLKVFIYSQITINNITLNR